MTDSTDLPCEFGDGRFGPQHWSQVVELVRAAPLAWVVSVGGGPPLATPLPLRPKLDALGRIVRLDGHFARRNLHAAALASDPSGLILFTGPQGYISPSWMRDRTQAPTWVYATAQFTCRFEMIEDPRRIEASLRDLVGGMEAGRSGSWSLEEMGERYARLARGVVAFEATVEGVSATFKLGQDEREDVFEDILRAVKQNDQRLADWMETSNRWRPSGGA